MYQSFVLIILSVLGLNLGSASIDAELSKLPKWWHNKVLEVRGSDQLLASQFRVKGAMASQALEYELAIERVSDKRGIIWARQFIQRSKFKARSQGFTTEFVDGFVKVEQAGKVSWVAVSRQQEKMIINEQKLYEIDLEAGLLHDLRMGVSRRLSIERTKVNKVRTFLVRVDNKVFSLEDYDSKFRLFPPGKSKSQAMLLIPGAGFDQMDKQSWDKEASLVEQRVADRLLEEKKYAEAIKSYSAAIKLNKWNVEAWTGRGYAYHHLGEYSQAVAHYEFKSTFGKEEEKDLLYRGNTAFVQNKYTDARRYYRATIAKNSSNAEANHQLALTIRKLSVWDIEQCVYFKKAASLNLEQYVSSEKSYCVFSEDELTSQLKPFYEREEGEEEALLGAIAYADFHEKVARQNRLKFDYDPSELQHYLASFYLSKEKELGKVARIYHQLLNSKKNDRDLRSRLWYELGLTYKADKKAGQAVEYFKNVVNSRADSGWEQFERMSLYHLVTLYKNDLKDYDQAYKYVDQLINVTIPYNSYVDYLIQGKETVRIVNAEKEDKSAELPVVILSSQVSKYEKYDYTSEESKRRASVLPLRLRAQINVFREDFKESIEDARLAAELDPQYSANCHYYMGLSMYSLEDWRGAVKHLLEAREQGFVIDDTGSFEYFVGSSSYRLGQHANGCALVAHSEAKGYSTADQFLDTYCFKSKAWNWSLGSGKGATNTDIYVREGDVVYITASGSIRFGAWAGSAGPEGMNGFSSYNKVNGAKHGALLFRVGDSGNWYIAGREASITSEKSGYLRLLINDNDPGNNSGTFKGKITVKTPIY